jgi:DNA-binding response OmpR family regulator
MTILRYPRAPRVLVVDNEPAICRALALMLRREGFAATTATSGETALAKLRAETFDLLLVDLRMPELRGDVLFHLACAIQPHLAHKTIFMTGDITAQAAQITDGLGCPVMLKPFDLRAVSRALWDLADGINGEAVG